MMFREEGALETYMYYPHMDAPGNCGLSDVSAARFTPSVWHELKLFIQINTGGAPLLSVSPLPYYTQKRSDTCLDVVMKLSR
jgi:hypothetical protein